MNNNLPLVTVGIPTFNRPLSLKRSLECISRQTYPNLEIIVSDNCSPGEETQRVVEDCMTKDVRIRYFRQSSNLGPVANFQFVLQQATGKYFMWMPDDDWRAPRYVEALLNELESDEAGVMAFCEISVFDEAGRISSDHEQSYLPYLRRLVSDSALVRQVRFYLQHEGYGKANLIYGMLRTREIKSLPIVAMHDLYGFYGLDNLIVFTQLGKGKLRLINEKLFACTAGNVKHYPSAKCITLQQKLQLVFWQFNYFFAYLKLSRGAVRFACAILLPVKLTLFYWNTIRKKFMKTSQASERHLL